MNALTDLLGIRYPIVQGPFGGGLSTVELAATVSKAGGLGSFGAHHLRPSEIIRVVEDIRLRTASPFAINLWVPQPGEADAIELDRHLKRMQPLYERLGVQWDPEFLHVPSFEDQVEALLSSTPEVMSFVMGIPPRWVVDRAKKQGTVLIGTATTIDEARVLEESGLDAIVASGADAGGHRGTFLKPLRESLIGTFSLVPQVADAVHIPVIAAGGIADHRGVAAAHTLGASGVQVGTGFLATKESGATAIHRSMLSSRAAETTVLTRLFSGRFARGIVNRLVRDMEDEESLVPPYPVQSRLMHPVRQAAAHQGDADHLSLWAGQAARLVRSGSIEAATYLETLIK